MAKRIRKSTRRSSRADADDFSIYVHRDFASRKSIQFAIRNYDASGALEEEQIATLSQAHNVPFHNLQKLSQELGFALDVETDASLVKISRSVVKRRLAERRNSHRPARNLLTVEQANALFDALNLPMRVWCDEGSDARADDVQTGLGSDSAITFVDLDTARRALEPDDRRTERDERRLLVVECCCYLALDLGWPITVTTDPSRDREARTGRLLELIRDVIEMTSQTGERVSVDTLASDIAFVRERFRMRGALNADTAV